MKALFLILCLFCVGRLSASNALQLGFMEGAAGSEIEIPIFHTGSTPVAGANFDFRFNPAKMELLEVQPGTATPDWTLDSEQTVANEVRLLLTHPTGASLPTGEVARIKVRLLETFTHSESTGTALARRDTPTPAADLTDCHWLPLVEVTSPTTGSKLANSAPNTIQFRVSPGEHPLASLDLLLQDHPVFTAPSVSARSFSWQPNLTAGGLLNLSIQATNEISLSSVSNSVEVLINTPPILATIPSKSVDELTQLTFTAVATDADLPANTLTYSLVSPPTGATINPSTGVFSWTLTESQGPGNFTITVRVSDGTATADQSVAVTVNEVNTAPVLAAIPAKSVNELAALTFTAAATDADLPANTLTYSLVTPPTGASINPTTGVFTWTPTESQGPGNFTIIVRVSDGTATHDQAVAVTVKEVNTAPVLASIPAKSVDELAALTFTASATDADLPANTLVYSLVTPPTGAAIDSATGVFTWTPTEAQGPGNFTITVRVSDGTATADQAVAVTVNEVNTAPVLASIPDKSVDELAQLTFTAVAIDADLPANTLTYSLVDAPTGAAIDPAIGILTWTPTEAQGPENFTITVRVSDGTATHDQAVAVTVNEVNTAPVLAAIPAKSLNELTQLTFTAAATDADLPANTLTYSLVDAPTGAAIDPATGIFTWTPTEAQGPENFTITVRVSDGTATADQAFDVTVNEVNTAPVLAAIPAKSVNELSQLTFTAVATDADLPANTLTYSLVDAPTGAAIDPTTGVFSWTPNKAKSPGNYRFGIQVSDGLVTASQEILVTVLDITPPEILHPAALVVIDLEGDGEIVNYSVTATDAVDGTVTVTGNPVSGAKFLSGTTLVQLSAVDLAGNRSTASFPVTLIQPGKLLQSTVISPATADSPATIVGRIVGGAPNSSVMLEASTELSPTSWQTIATIPLGQDGTADFGPISVDGSENTHKYFFRCRFEAGQVK